MSLPLRHAAPLAALAAAGLMPVPVQLAAAAVAIGGPGMLHGASDLAVVAPRRRAGFLLAYVAVLAGVAGWWLASPAAALPLFLALSAAHFAVEDADAAGWGERVIAGLLPIVAPALLHRASLSALLAAASGAPIAAGEAATAMLTAALLVVPVAALLAWRRRDGVLALGVAMLVMLPPLVGFAAGFLVLHAWPQSAERARQLGCATPAAYRRRVAPVMVAAGGVVVLVVAAVLRFDPSGIRALFAAIAALAVPHMLVTPLFTRGEAPAPRGAPLPA